MVSETAARTEVLRRIRAAIGEPARVEQASVETEWKVIPRNYQRHGTLAHEAVLELLEDRLRDYDAHVERVSQADLAPAIARLLAARGIRRMLAPIELAEVLRDSFGQSLPEGFEFIPDTGLRYDQIDALEGVLTTAQLAIATTGTLVLQTVPGQGRRAGTLIPDYHLCLVRLDDVVETVPEGFDRLAATAALATTFISGPSATADIEMTRIKGVHGPRYLDVVLVE